MPTHYFDHNATTPLGGAALTAMRPYLEGQFGNPLTAHRFGEAPRAAVTSARGDVLSLFEPIEEAAWDVVFNSGASEGLNHALKGLAFASLVDGRPGPRRRIVIGALEHYAVTKPAHWLADTFGFEVVTIPSDERGVVRADAFCAAIDPETTLLATLHWANNELGTVQPVREVGSACREAGVPFVCDAVQPVGKLDLAGGTAFADVLALSAHKFYGPKGVGALMVRRGVDLTPLVHGASQEDGARGGTHNVPGIVGLGVAARCAGDEQPREAARLSRLRDELWLDIERRTRGAHWNGRGAPLLPNTLNVSFDGCPSNLLCEEMDRRGFAISAGAACLSGTVKPSKNVLALGLGEARAQCSVRISLGHATTEHDVRALADAFGDATEKVREGL
jgi:cysteine desulfurase